MSNIQKNEETKDNVEEIKNIDKTKENKDEEKEENKETTKPRTIGTVGNYILAVLVIVILGTGALTYYLVNSARRDLENNSDILSTNTDDDEDEPTKIANIIDTVISDVTTPQNTVLNNVDASSIKLLNEDLIVLYNGLILETDKMEEKELKYIDYSNELKENYVITYYNYENFAFKESKLGTLSSQVFDGVVKVENVGKVAISENYNAIPREVKVVNSIPTIVADNNAKITEFDITKTIITDLDGNGSDEYVLILANRNTGYSKIMLADTRGSKVADLAYIEKSKWDVATNEEYYLSISNIEIIDVDNDGNMEILIELPKSDGANTTISLLKYKGGELLGKTNIECSLVKN